MAKPGARLCLMCLCSWLASVSPGDAKEKITFTSKTSERHPAKPDACDIQVFQDARPEQAHVELGVINYHDERHRTNAGSLKLEKVLPAIKARACKLGADGLMDVRVTEVRRLEFAMFNVRAAVIRFARN